MFLVICSSLLRCSVGEAFGTTGSWALEDKLHSVATHMTAELPLLSIHSGHKTTTNVHNCTIQNQISQIPAFIHTVTSPRSLTSGNFFAIMGGRMTSLFTGKESSYILILLGFLKFQNLQSTVAK